MPSSSDQFPDPWNVNRPSDGESSDPKENPKSDEADDDFGLAELEALLSDGSDSSPSESTTSSLDDLSELLSFNTDTSDADDNPDFDAMLASLGMSSASKPDPDPLGNIDQGIDINPPTDQLESVLPSEASSSPDPLSNLSETSGDVAIPDLSLETPEIESIEPRSFEVEPDPLLGSIPPANLDAGDADTVSALSDTGPDLSALDSISSDIESLDPSVEPFAPNLPNVSPAIELNEPSASDSSEDVDFIPPINPSSEIPTLSSEVTPTQIQIDENPIEGIDIPSQSTDSPSQSRSDSRLEDVTPVTPGLAASATPAASIPSSSISPAMTSASSGDGSDSQTQTPVSAATSRPSSSKQAVNIPVVGTSTYKQILSGRPQMSAFALVLAGMGGMMGYGWSKANLPNPLAADFNEPGLGLLADEGDRSDAEQPSATVSNASSNVESPVAQNQPTSSEPRKDASTASFLTPSSPSIANAQADTQNIGQNTDIPGGTGISNIGGIDDLDPSELANSDVTTGSGDETQQAPPPIDISDVPPEHWAHPYVIAMHEQGVIPDFPDGKFQPDKPVTRAELAASIQRAFKDKADSEPIPFSDISEGYWAKDAITHAVNTGFMSGYSEDIFEPNQQIPRYQVLVSLVSGLGLEKIDNPEEATNVLQSYPDLDSMPEWAFGQVAASKNANLIVNKPEDGNILSPNRPATRAEVSAMIYKALVNADEIEDTVN